MFYGYNNEAEMRQHNPQIAEILIKSAKSSKTNVCARNKNCVAYFDGEYRYSDGSRDGGVEETKYRAEFDNNVFCWHKWLRNILRGDKKNFKKIWLKIATK